MSKNRKKQGKKGKQIDFVVGHRVHLRVDSPKLEPDNLAISGTITKMWDCRCVYVDWDDPAREVGICKVDELLHTHPPFQLIHRPKPTSRKLYRTLP